MVHMGHLLVINYFKTIFNQFSYCLRISRFYVQNCKFYHVLNFLVNLYIRVFIIVHNNYFWYWAIWSNFKPALTLSENFKILGAKLRILACSKLFGDFIHVGLHNCTQLVFPVHKQSQLRTSDFSHCVKISWLKVQNCDQNRGSNHFGLFLTCGSL